MADKKDEGFCANDSCNCPVAEGAKYCSPPCRAANESGMTSIACECGHADCAGEVDVADPYVRTTAM
jgi:hypothetical protein